MWSTVNPIGEMITTGKNREEEHGVSHPTFHQHVAILRLGLRLKLGQRAVLTVRTSEVAIRIPRFLWWLRDPLMLILVKHSEWVGQ